MTVRIHETAALALPAEAPPSGGRMLLRLIDVGEGSSGYYPPDALRAAAAGRVFPQGTHCYIDHAAAIRRGPSGERSIRDLAGVLESDARWDEQLQALVSEVRLLAPFAERLRDLAPHIGISISATARVRPALSPGAKPTITAITSAESVDFVVKAGRGGSVLAILESAPAKPVAESAPAGGWTSSNSKRTLWDRPGEQPKTVTEAHRTLWDRFRTTKEN